MSTTELTLRTWNDTFERETGTHYTFKLRRLKAYFLEWEDLHFNHDSSVLIADHRKTTQADDDGSNTDHKQEHITALTVIATAYEHSKDHPERKLLLTGHTDRSGDASYNLELSKRRAENVLHVLRGNKEAWAQHNTPTTHHKVEDYQQLLTWLYKEHGWDTDPGEIDNKLGPTTKAAVKRFQIRYNQEFKGSIAEDGLMGRESWAAFFDIYMQELCGILAVDEAGLATMQQSLRFLNNPEGVGCGENFPKTSLNRSRTDRRVELFFFDPGEEPTLPLRCHPSGVKCIKDACEIRDEKLYKLEPIPVNIKHIRRVPVVLDDPLLGFLVDLSVKVTHADGSTETLTTDADGIVKVLADHGHYVDLEFTTALRNHALRVFLLPEAVTTKAGAWQRLVNLGYVQQPKPPKAPPTEMAFQLALSEFQAMHGINPTGALDERTCVALRKSHDEVIPWSKVDRPSLPDERFAESASLRKDMLA